MMSDLTNDVAIVTGAGRRIGRLHAIALAEAGASVIVNDVDGAVADRVVDEIVENGGRAAAVTASVADQEGAAAIVAAAVEHFGTVDILVNNAGFMRNAYIEDITPDMLDSVLGVNLNGAFYVSQAAWPVMRERGHGRIVMTSSGGGMFSMAAASNYAAAKAGVYGLTKSLAIEGAPHGIAVNALLPHANALDDDNATMTAEDSQKWNDQNWGTPDIEPYLVPEFLDLYDRRDPRYVTPLVVYLASRACEVNGEAFAAGMGRYARVFVGEGPGWRSPDGAFPSPADIAENIDDVRRTDGGDIPWDVVAETVYLGRED